MKYYILDVAFVNGVGKDMLAVVRRSDLFVVAMLKFTMDGDTEAFRRENFEYVFYIKVQDFRLAERTFHTITTGKLPMYYGHIMASSLSKEKLM